MFTIPPGKWEGLDGWGDDMLRQLRPQAERSVLQAVVYAAGELKKTLSGTRTGRPYRINPTKGKSGRSLKAIFHIASRPGEPPAVMFGNLRNSVGWSEPVWEDGPEGAIVSAEFGVGLGTKPKGGIQEPEKTYARRLEFGGTDKRGVKIEPRPYMEPTVARISPTIEDMMERSFT